MDKIRCSFCRNVGHNGAQWILRIGNDRLRVHRPCGQRLIAQAPKGIEVKLFPSKELAEQRRVEAFWREKFHGAETQAARKQGA